MSAPLSRSIQVLMVEDNPGDVRLVSEALREAQGRYFIHVVEDGIEALAYLRKESGYENVRYPDLILLDLNLPQKDGREVLAAIKTDEKLRRIPVIVLSTSQAEQDILKSYDLQANAYVTKPANLEQFITAVKSIGEFWLETVKLPSDTRG